MNARLVWKLTTVFLVVFMLAAVWPAHPASAQAAPTATVNTGALHIRSGPGVSYGVVFSVYRGTALTLLARNPDASWVKIALNNGVQGWVNVFYIATSYPLFNLPLEGGTIPGGNSATVNTGTLNVRSGPSVSYAILVKIPLGTAVTLLARTVDNTWVKIQLSTGTQGWVNARYLNITFPISGLPVENVPGPLPPPTYPPTNPYPPTYPNYRTHVVQQGENLFRISLNYGVNMYEVARLNGIYDLTRVYVGQVLLIP